MDTWVPPWLGEGRDTPGIRAGPRGMSQKSRPVKVGTRTHVAHPTTASPERPAASTSVWAQGTDSSQLVPRMWPAARLVPSAQQPTCPSTCLHKEVLAWPGCMLTPSQCSRWGCPLTHLFLPGFPAPASLASTLGAPGLHGSWWDSPNTSPWQSPLPVHCTRLDYTQGPQRNRRSHPAGPPLQPAGRGAVTFMAKTSAEDQSPQFAAARVTRKISPQPRGRGFPFSPRAVGASWW